jgi:hypothetical protein
MESVQNKEVTEANSVDVELNEHQLDVVSGGVWGQNGCTTGLPVLKPIVKPMPGDVVGPDVIGLPGGPIDPATTYL